VLDQLPPVAASHLIYGATSVTNMSICGTRFCPRTRPRAFPVVGASVFCLSVGRGPPGSLRTDEKLLQYFSCDSNIRIVILQLSRETSEDWQMWCSIVGQLHRETSALPGITVSHTQLWSFSAAPNARDANYCYRCARCLSVSLSVTAAPLARLHCAGVIRCNFLKKIGFSFANQIAF